MKITCTNKADVNFKLFVGVAVDYAIFTAPSPSFQNFRYLSFYDRKCLIVKKNKRCCYQSQSSMRNFQISLRINQKPFF